MHWSSEFVNSELEFPAFRYWFVVRIERKRRFLNHTLFLKFWVIFELAANIVVSSSEITGKLSPAIVFL